jgi:hypothetical protein
MIPRPLGSGTALHVAPELLVAHITARHPSPALSSSSPAIQHVDETVQLTVSSSTADASLPASTGLSNDHVIPPSFVDMTSGERGNVVPVWTIA